MAQALSEEERAVSVVWHELLTVGVRVSTPATWRAGIVIFRSGIAIAFERPGTVNIGFWDDPAERVHWLMYVAKGGWYNVAGDFAPVHGQCLLTAEVAGQRMPSTVTSTGRWDQPALGETGAIRFDKVGVYHLVLGATDRNKWRAVNVWDIKLAPQP